MAATHCTKCGERQSPDARFCPRCGTAIVAQAAAAVDALVGKVIAERYLLTERIGQGASGIIYRAEHTTLKRKMAVKVLHPQLSKDEAAVDRFRREATTVGQIDNDHILQVLDFGRTDDQRLFFAMELLEGETLDKVLAKEGKLAPERAVKILAQVADALAEAHDLGYIHRDLRPRNLFLALRRGDRDFVKLLDFGLAKLVEPEMETKQTALGMTFGDPRYMSPEQARGDAIDRRSDVFSLGVVAYEMLTGVPPFSGLGPFDVLQKVLDSPTPHARDKRSDCPPWLDAVIHKALQKKVDDRFTDMKTMLACLRSASPPVAEAAAAPAGRTIPEASAPLVPHPSAAPQPVGPARTLMMQTALPASVAAAQAATTAAAPARPASVPASGATDFDDPTIKTPRLPEPEPALPILPTSSFDEQTNPGRKPAIRDLPPATPVSNASPVSVAGEVKAPIRPDSEPTTPSSSIVVEQDEGMAPMRAEPTGPHRVSGDDGWFAERAPVPDTFEEEEGVPRRRTPMLIGIVAGGVSLAIFTGLLLWPRAHRPAKPSAATAAAPTPPPAAAPTPTPAPPPEAPPTAAPVAAAEPPSPSPSPSASPSPTPSASPSPTPSPSASPSPTPSASPSPTPSASPSPTPSPSPPPAVAARPEPRPEPVVSKKPEPEPAPVAVRKPEPRPEPKVEPVAVRKPEPKPEPIAAKKPDPKPEPSTSKSSRSVPFKDPFAATAPQPGAIDALIKVGRQKLAAGDLAQAQASFQQAKELSGKNADAYAGLGEVAFEQGEYAAAASQLKQALKLSPNRARFLILLGQSYYKLGRAKDAVQEYKKALKVDPTNQEAARSLELAERKVAQGG